MIAWKASILYILYYSSFRGTVLYKLKQWQKSYAWHTSMSMFVSSFSFSFPFPVFLPKSAKDSQRHLISAWPSAGRSDYTNLYFRSGLCATLAYLWYGSWRILARGYRSCLSFSSCAAWPAAFPAHWQGRG